MNPKQKQIAMIAGGALVLILLYRWYTGSRNQAATGTSTPATDTAASDYASLAGQEQGDVAALQGQNADLLTQEQGDVSGLTTAIGDLAGVVSSINDSITGQQSQIASIAAGQTKIDRALTATIGTKKGGAFYKYYVKVTGHAPPARVSASNFVYQAWKSGVKATALAKPTAHPSSKNTHIQHPNGGHQVMGHIARPTGIFPTVSRTASTTLRPTPKIQTPMHAPPAPKPRKKPAQRRGH